MTTSRKHFMALCILLAAGCLRPAGAAESAQPTSPEPGAAGQPTAAEASKRIRWDVTWRERRYKIEALRFKAVDETGIDWLGSDEVIVETHDPKGWTASPLFEDIDTGTTHTFIPAKSCILAVRPGNATLGESSVCDEAGEPAPLEFQVEFWEQDWIGFPNGFCIAGVEPLEPGRHRGPWHAKCPFTTNFNDFIGSADIHYSTQELEAALPNVGDTQIESIRLDSCPGSVCSTYSEYTFTWRVTRLPDQLVNFPLVLSDAMRRGGAGSELEAIRAGLRDLRAPAPRKFERTSDRLSAER